MGMVMERAGRVRLTRNAGASPMVYPVAPVLDRVEMAGVNNNSNTFIGPFLPRVPLPTNSEWDITICSVISTNQVTLWLGEAASKLTKLHDDMLTHHSHSSPPLVGEICSAPVDAHGVR